MLAGVVAGGPPGAVLVAGCQVAAGQPGGLQPELLAGSAQERLGGLVQRQAAVGQAEAGGRVGVLVVPAAGQRLVSAGAALALPLSSSR